MCEPMTAALVLGGANAATSLFGGRKRNKSANKLARAQAEAARKQFYNDRTRIEMNYAMDSESLAEQERMADEQHAVEEHNLLVSIGDAVPLGNSSNKILQNTFASGALNIAALAQTAENRRTVAVTQLKDNQSNYQGRLQEIKGQLNKSFQSNTELTINAVSSGLQGFAAGATAGKALKT